MTTRSSNSMHIINTILLGVISIILYLGYDFLVQTRQDELKRENRVTTIENEINRVSGEHNTIKQDVETIKLNYVKREEIEQWLLKNRQP